MNFFGGFSLKFLFLTGLCLGIFGCQSKPKKAELSAEVEYLHSKEASVVLSEGFNRSAVFSEDGEKIFYISQNRKGHKNTQIHEYDLTMQKDRRVTFQDGEILSIIPLENERILYSSTTDEIKEQPFATGGDPRYPKSEIYYSDLFGNEIDRLTNSPGFDGEMLYVPEKKQVLFTSLRSGTPGLYWLDLTTKKVLPFQVDKERPQRSPSLSPDGKTLYWIEENPGDKTQNIIKATFLGKDRTVVKNLKGVINSVLLNHRNELIYSCLPEGAEFSQMDLYDESKVCTQALLKYKIHFSEMRFSIKNPNLMIFRVAAGDNSQIYRWELPLDLAPCNEGSPSDTLKK
ncbi:MAG: TolB family protein [Pseudobdellovibrionaceae bacterium]